MEQLATVKIELGISAQKIISQIQTNNKQLEESVSKGIERALKELLENDNFEYIISESVKEEIQRTIKSAASDWSFRYKIQDAMSKAVNEKIDALANSWAAKALKNIKP